jgi:hypothetical protein
MFWGNLLLPSSGPKNWPRAEKISSDKGGERTRRSRGRFPKGTIRILVIVNRILALKRATSKTKRMEKIMAMSSKFLSHDRVKGSD